MKSRGWRIAKARPDEIFSANPYRTILRKSIPEPIIALLAFVFGIWIWDHYLGDPVGYDIGLEEIALLKIDRDLRLAEAMAGDPAWLQRFAGARSSEVLLAEAIGVLEILEARQVMTSRGKEAFAVMLAMRDDVPVLKMLERNGISNFESTDDPELARGSWWQARILRAHAANGTATGGWPTSYERSLRTLRTRAVGISSAILVLAIGGAFFVPRTFRRLFAGLRERARGYSGAWTPALGVTVFIVGTLAWIGFVTVLDFGIQASKGVSPMMMILLDTAARLLPTLIVIGFLFKKPSHVVRVLGLNRGLHPGMILGMFTLLLIADQLLRRALGGVPDSEPGGGLSLGEAGLGGLIFIVVSACVVAPVSEEILYRGVLFRALGNGFGVFPAALVSAVVFSMIHFYGAYGFTSVAIFGFSCALMYAGTGSLISVIALHGLYNLSIKLPEWIFYHAKLDW